MFEISLLFFALFLQALNRFMGIMGNECSRIS